MLPMLNFASLPKASPEMLSNAPANPFGISSPAGADAQPFSSVLSRAWAAQSSIRNNQTGAHPNPAQRPQPGGMDSTIPFQPPATNPAGVYSPVMANPPVTSAQAPSATPPQTTLPLSAPIDTGANPSSPSPLKSAFLDAASIAASMFGFSGKLAMAAASGIAAALDGSGTASAPAAASPQNAAPAAAGQAASSAPASIAPGAAVDVGTAADEITVLLASDQQSAGTATRDSAPLNVSQAPANPAAPAMSTVAPNAPAAQVPHPAAAADAVLPDASKLIMPQATLTLANAGPASNQNISAQVAANSLVAVGADTQKTVSDSRQRIVSQISSHLQSVLDGASAKVVQPPGGSAGANAAPGNSSGNSSSGTSSNSSNAGSQNGSQDAATASAETAASDATKTATQPDAKDSAISSAAATKAAGMAAMAASTSTHVADSSSASAGASNTPADAAPANNARASSLPLPLPASLPASLQDVVNASALYQRVGGADMHIAMQMDLLGSVDLHASIHQGALTATIGVQHTDVQALLSNDLPILQHALAEQNLHVEQISVLDHSAGGRMDLGGHAQQQPQQQTFPPAVQRLVRDVGYGGSENTVIAATQSKAPRASQGRLSILA